MWVDELGMGPSNEANTVIITPVPFLSLVSKAVLCTEKNTCDMHIVYS